jgi:hypothetical protein
MNIELRRGRFWTRFTPSSFVRVVLFKGISAVTLEPIFASKLRTARAVLSRSAANSVDTPLSLQEYISPKYVRDSLAWWRERERERERERSFQ